MFCLTVRKTVISLGCLLALGSAIVCGRAFGATEPGGERQAERALDEITVTGRYRQADRRQSGTVHSIPSTAIRRTDPVTVADALSLAPGAHLQTNSRGETLVFLRGAGERQVALFLNGALLNVPWDNRVDLSLVPAAAVGGMTVAKGASSVQYGTNTIGGAINIKTLNAPERGARTEAVLRRGGHGLWHGSLIHRRRAGALGLVLAGGYQRREGLPLPEGADLPFGQIGDAARTNTDRQAHNLLLRADLPLGSSADLGATLLFVDGKQGVAVQGNRNPAVASPRYWRYPDWRMVMGILSGEGRAWNVLEWKTALWVQSFNQTIDSYDSLAFERLEERQADENLTVGGRIAAAYEQGPHRFLFAFNGLGSTHRQSNTAFVQGSDGAAQTTGQARRLSFQQWTFSNGVEYSFTPRDELQFLIGGSVDLFTTPLTGDKPPLQDFIAWTLNASMRLDLGAGWQVKASGGRKARFPTLRELFGQAIDRFQINPGLEPETAVLADLGLNWQGTAGRFSVTGFANFTADTIDQRNLVVEGRSLRQRINLPGSRILGIEAEGRAQLTESLSIRGHAAVMDVRRQPRFAGDFTRLSEKPETIGRVALAYDGADGLSAMAAVEHRGRAYTLADDDRFVPLDISTTLNLRLAYDLAQSSPKLNRLELFLRADNVTDAIVEPQLGLPAAGRWISGGIRAAF